MIHAIRNIGPNVPGRAVTAPTGSTSTSTSSTSSSSTASSSTASGPSPFQLLFSGQAVAVPSTQQTPQIASATLPVTGSAVSSAPTPAPTAESVFGDNPWVSNPTGSGLGQSWGYNPQYFATPETAQQVATMMGGKVVTENAIAPYGTLTQDQPNEMVKLPNGALINPGLVAGFYTHGYSQTMIDSMIKNEEQG